MKFLLDMNLSPNLATVLSQAGFQTIHWSDVGDPRATDRSILNWAMENNFSIITNDLDFGAILAASNADCPSVIQIRAQDVSPGHIAPIIFTVLEKYEKYIEDGALISVDETLSRARILPIK